MEWQPEEKHVRKPLLMVNEDEEIKRFF